MTEGSGVLLWRFARVEEYGFNVSLSLSGKQQMSRKPRDDKGFTLARLAPVRGLSSKTVRIRHRVTVLLDWSSIIQSVNAVVANGAKQPNNGTVYGAQKGQKKDEKGQIFLAPARSTELLTPLLRFAVQRFEPDLCAELTNQFILRLNTSSSFGFIGDGRRSIEVSSPVGESICGITRLNRWDRTRSSSRSTFGLLKEASYRL